MNVVVDTSVVIAVVADEPQKPALIAQTQGADLLAPQSLRWEIGNAFSAVLKRRRITIDQAQAAITVNKPQMNTDKHRFSAPAFISVHPCSSVVRFSAAL